jgi:hypothetical protein
MTTHRHNPNHRPQAIECLEHKEHPSESSILGKSATSLNVDSPPSVLRLEQLIELELQCPGASPEPLTPVCLALPESRLQCALEALGKQVSMPMLASLIDWMEAVLSLGA